MAVLPHVARWSDPEVSLDSCQSASMVMERHGKLLCLPQIIPKIEDCLLQGVELSLYTVNPQIKVFNPLHDVIKALVSLCARRRKFFLNEPR